MRTQVSRWGREGALPQIWSYKSPGACGLCIQPGIVTGITVTMAFIPVPSYQPAYNLVGIIPRGPVTPPSMGT